MLEMANMNDQSGTEFAQRLPTAGGPETAWKSRAICVYLHV